MLLVLILSIVFVSCSRASVEDIPKLVTALRHKDSSVRNKAALDLASLGPEAKPATAALIRLLQDENGGVRTSAAVALRAIDTPAAIRALDNYRK